MHRTVNQSIDKELCVKVGTAICPDGPCKYIKTGPWGEEHAHVVVVTIPFVGENGIKNEGP